MIDAGQGMSPGQAEQNDLSGGHPAIGEAPLNIQRMLALMRVGVDRRIDVKELAFEFLFLVTVR